MASRKTQVTLRKVKNTLKKMNDYATPILTAGSVIAPQFAPAFAGAKAVLSAADHVSNTAYKNFV
jgi:hypothetical protein